MDRFAGRAWVFFGLICASAHAQVGEAGAGGRAQIATAVGDCNIVINASDNAQVGVDLRCESTGQVAAMDRRLEAVIQTVVDLQKQSNVSLDIASLQRLRLKQLDLAAELLGREAARSAARAAQLYRDQGALLKIARPLAALEAVRNSLALAPTDVTTLIDAGDLALSAQGPSWARAWYELALREADRQAPERREAGQIWTAYRLFRKLELTADCWRRWNIDHLCRMNFDQGLGLPPHEVSCA